MIPGEPLLPLNCTVKNFVKEEKKMRKISIVILALLLVLGVSKNIFAATYLVFDDFSSTSGIVLNGDAHIANTTDGDVLRLAPAVVNKSGSAFSSLRFNVSGFSTFFSFRITEPGGVYDLSNKYGADGLAFVIQPISSSTLGGAGGGIGYYGISPSIAVEFDTYHNPQDPSSNHLGLNINGSINHDLGFPTADVNPPFDDGSVWYAWIDYDGSTLEVRVNQTGIRPQVAMISHLIDANSILGTSDAYVGFTAATGGGWGNHDILSWEYRDEYKPIDKPCKSDCKGDFDCDGDVDGTDLAGFAASFGRTDCLVQF